MKNEVIKTYRSLSSVPERLRPYAIPKDYGVDEDTGRGIVVYKIYLSTVPAELLKELKYED